MSLNLSIKNKIFNTAPVVSDANGVVTIGDISFPVDAVTNCFRECTTPCTKQVVLVVFQNPGACDDCGFIHELTVRKLQCGFDRSEDVLGGSYTYQMGNAHAPISAAQFDLSLLNQVNSDPNAIVTAAFNGGTNNGTGVILTEKNCDDDVLGTCGLVVSGDATITVSTPHVEGILPIYVAQRLFSIKPGDFGTNPQTALCASAYCRYYFRIDPVATIADPHVANATISKYREIAIWINANDAGAIAADTALTDLFDCLGAPLES